MDPVLKGIIDNQKLMLEAIERITNILADMTEKRDGETK